MSIRLQELQEFLRISCRQLPSPKLAKRNFHTGSSFFT